LFLICVSSVTKAMNCICPPQIGNGKGNTSQILRSKSPAGVALASAFVSGWVYEFAGLLLRQQNCHTYVSSGSAAVTRIARLNDRYVASRSTNYGPAFSLDPSARAKMPKIPAKGSSRLIPDFRLSELIAPKRSLRIQARWQIGMHLNGSPLPLFASN
jgi:hypothetical protein